MSKENKIQDFLTFGLIGNLLLLVLIILVSFVGITEIRNSFVSNNHYMENSFNRLELVKILFSINNDLENWQSYTRQHILSYNNQEKTKLEDQINTLKTDISQDINNYEALTRVGSDKSVLIDRFKSRINDYGDYNREIIQKSRESKAIDNSELANNTINKNYIEAKEALDALINLHVNNSISEQELSYQFYDKTMNSITLSITALVILGSLTLLISLIKGIISIKISSGHLEMIAAKEQELLDHNIILQEKEKQLKLNNKALIKAKEDLEYANRELIIINKSLRELDEMKNNFISTVSHELRTPLTSIKGSLGLILNNIVGNPDDETKTFLKISYKNTERLINLINEILDLAKLEAGKIELHKENLNLTQLINESIEGISTYAMNNNVIILNELEEDIDVYADVQKLNQVLYNLLSNAVKFTTNDNNHQALVRISATRGINHTQINIIDNGIGIPEDKINYIFEKFTQIDNSATRSKEGTGLGLAICKAIIEEHRGIIWVDNNADRGVTFSFTIATKELQDQYQEARRYLSGSQN
jgi:signal transduction histidine kinase